MSEMFLDRFESLREEGRALVNAGVQVAFLPRTTLALTLYNLGDKRDAVDALQQPLPGFSMTGALRVQL